MVDKRKTTPVVKPLPSLWGDEEEKKIKVSNWKPFITLDKKLEKFKETEAVGYGIERCLYELNPTLSCLSPYLIHAAVLTPAEALIALEEVAGEPDRPQSPVDRHLAAFLMSRWKGLSHADLQDLGEPQREIKSLAILRVLAGIQVYFKVGELPNLCQWVAELCAALIAQYRNLADRERINRDIAKAVATGQLANLLKIFVNRREMEKDEEEFKAARAEVWLIESEIKEIEAKIRNRNQFVPHPQPNFWEKTSLFLSGIMQVGAIKQGKGRIERLYQRWVILCEVWGDALLRQSDNSSRVFWKNLWAKMQEPESPDTPPKKAVDAPLKYD
jgi:hypothetical protein